MPDVVDRETRSRMMAGIRGKNTQPELFLRRSLHRLGFRYRLHVPDLPGKPDIVFPRLRAVIQVHGCFWHHHDCHLFKWPSSRSKFWRSKITRNGEKDIETLDALTKNGWRVLTIWECALKGRTRLEADEIIADVKNWLLRGKNNKIVQGGM
jgi:DNA mismatch endonuclease (patch repair protein)